VTAAKRPLTGVRLLYIVNVDWFLVSHRLPIVRAAIDAGADVTVACADTGAMAPIEALGAVRVVALPLSRSGTGLFGEARSLAAIAGLIWRTKPDIVHNVTIKPVMYGTLLTRLLRRRTRVVNAVSGFGYAVEGDAHKVLSSLVLAAYRLLFRSRRVEMIVQNDGAAQWLLRHRCTSLKHIHVIEGSGVDCERFTPPSTPRAEQPLTVLLASRMLRDKGVAEFAEAARMLRPKHPDAMFVLAGSTDVGGNPTSYTDDEMRQLEAAFPVRWTGHVADMPALLQTADVFALPSYHEGLPKALLEAAATGLPLVATDIDGCRPVVTSGVNGELVALGDAEALAATLDRLLSDAGLRRRYGDASRRIAVDRFAIERVVAATLQVYAQAGSAGPRR
jgi:glycosyltransferase involved in cell wall biosynthesis